MTMNNHHAAANSATDEEARADQQDTTATVLDDNAFCALLAARTTPGQSLPPSSAMFPYLHGTGMPLDQDPQPRPLLLLRVGSTRHLCATGRAATPDSLSDMDLDDALLLEEDKEEKEADPWYGPRVLSSVVANTTWIGSASVGQILQHLPTRGWVFRATPPTFQQQTRYFSGQSAVWASLADIVVYGSADMASLADGDAQRPDSADARDVVAARVRHAQCEFAARTSIAVNDWQERHTFVFKGDETYVAQRHPEFVYSDQHRQISPLYDMVHREGISMYELAAPVEISPSLWFGHADHTVKAGPCMLPTGAHHYPVMAMAERKSTAPPDTEQHTTDSNAHRTREERKRKKPDSSSAHQPPRQQLPTVPISVTSPVMLSPPTAMLPAMPRPLAPPPLAPTSTPVTPANTVYIARPCRFRQIVRIRGGAASAVRADLEQRLERLKAEEGRADEPDILYVAPWHPASRSTAVAQLLDLVWYLTRLTAPPNPTPTLIYYDFNDDSFLYASALALAYCMQRHHDSLPRACMRINTLSHVYLNNFRETLQDLEDELWLHFETERAMLLDADAAARDSVAPPACAAPLPAGVSCAWFYNSSFDGSFPSRILPYVYLGDLVQANNVGLLRAFGITHILSVGIRPTHTDSGLDMFYLEDVEDDGHDNLLGHFDACNAYIDTARAGGGKVLVHCQVGTSRSATVVIAYVMHRFRELSLLDAYFVVRARRLLLVIQPNLRFVYNLLEYEWRLRRSLSLPWVDMARGISLLNNTC